MTIQNRGKRLGAYLIVDTAAHQITLIYYGTTLHKRIQRAELSQAVLDTTQVSVPPKPTYEFFCNVDRQVPQAPFFGDDGAFFRGVLTAVNVSGSPHAYVSEMHARTLVGTYRRLGQGLGSSYEEHNTSFVLDETNTLLSNNGRLSIAQVAANIAVILTTAGYSQ